MQEISLRAVDIPKWVSSKIGCQAHPAPRPLELAMTISGAAYRDTVPAQHAWMASDLAAKLLVQGRSVRTDPQRTPDGISEPARSIRGSAPQTLILINVSCARQGLLANGGWSGQCPWRDIFPLSAACCSRCFLSWTRAFRNSRSRRSQRSICPSFVFLPIGNG